MKLGYFTGVPLAQFVDESAVDYVGARQVVGRDRSVLVAGYAQRFEAQLRPADPRGHPEFDIKVVQRHLRAIGWPLVVDGILGTFTRRAVSDFQRGYLLDELVPTGEPDQATEEALARCAADRGRLSDHFYFAEFQTGGQRKLSINNHSIMVERDLVRALEAYRILAGQPVRIASGYRSVGYNLRVGGAADSAHLEGRAVNLWSPHLEAAEVAALGAFSRIGVRDDRVVHLEVDPSGPGGPPEVWSLDINP